MGLQALAAPSSSCSKLQLLQTLAAPNSTCSKLHLLQAPAAASSAGASTSSSFNGCLLQAALEWRLQAAAAPSGRSSVLWRACLVGALLDAPGCGWWAVGGGTAGWPGGPWPCRVQDPCSTALGPGGCPNPLCAQRDARGRQRRRDAGGRQRSRGNCAGVGYGGLRWAAVGRVCARLMSAGRLVGLGTQGGRPFILYTPYRLYRWLGFAWQGPTAGYSPLCI